MKWRAAAGLTLLALLLAANACVTTGPEGKSSLVLISTPQEVEMGKEMDAQIREQDTLLPDTVWQNYLAEVGQKIVAVSDRKDLDYSFHVIASDQLNAFAAPGGFVYFYTGILKQMDSEAELAAVMAHEISHVVARHGIKKLQTVMGVSVLLQIALGESSNLTQQAVGIVLNLGLTGYGRSMELEADRFGVIYMTRAGYNPNGAVAMFERLASLSGSGHSSVFEQMLSTHPDTQERISKIKAQIPTLGPGATELPMYSERYMEMRKRLPESSE